MKLNREEHQKSIEHSFVFTVDYRIVIRNVEKEKTLELMNWMNDEWWLDEMMDWEEKLPFKANVNILFTDYNADDTSTATCLLLSQ